MSKKKTTKAKATKSAKAATPGVQVKKDAKGRAEEARTVKYVAKQQGRNLAPIMEQQPGDEVLHYEYASETDRIGTVKNRTKVKE